ncbi:MAG: hypothetical protein B7X86_13645 [Sphingobacteriales bacterium 17-39-43]|nr:MAG: hypothetical protein B7Y24_16900 [Sphingobacteriales bacterium 16-39-50]OZA23148.1 MAG: hypothetical protein B7X86_13645 [Sphingobacteriales bacterium 17-39-43]
MFKSTTTYTVSKLAYLDTIFTNGLPVNAFINKGRCGIGGTSLEIKDKSRSTLIIVPNIGIIKNKLNATDLKDRPDYGVWGERSDSQILEYLNDRRLGVKIMCTPESIKRVFKAADHIGRLQEIFTQWLLLLDESHTFISEAYRENILLPFNYFWEFTNKTIISATPYFFSDERFNQLDYHEINFDEPLDTITLVNSASVEGALKHILETAHEDDCSYHIFYNSVTAIRDIILKSNIKGCTIHCARSTENMEKLGELTKYFTDEPASPYNKINFYTSKYFEGWDLPKQRAIMVLVTDVFKPHTKVGIGSKGKQAIGRLRGISPQKIYHVTNHESHSKMILLSEYKQMFTRSAQSLIENNNRYLNEGHAKKFLDNKGLYKLADIDEQTGLASINLMKVDQQINESAANEIYRNISFIKRDWEQSFFKTVVATSDYKIDTKTKLKRASSMDKFREDYEHLKAYKGDSVGTFYMGKNIEDYIRSRNPLVVDAYNLLDEAFITGSKFNVKKIETAVILKSNELSKTKLKQLAKKVFKRDEFYANSDIRRKLDKLYVKLNIINPKTGEVAKSKPIHLEQLGFRIEARKGKNEAGEWEHGYTITSYDLGLKIVG